MTKVVSAGSPKGAAKAALIHMFGKNAVTFTKPGLYKYFCDIHPGMIGYVVVRPHGQPIPSAEQDAATLHREIANVILTVKKLTKTKARRQARQHRSRGAKRRRAVHDVPRHPAGQSGHRRDLLDVAGHA